MNQRIKIFWGNVSEEYKRDFRNRLREAMRSSGLLPHWKEFSKKNRLTAVGQVTRLHFTRLKIHKVNVDALPDPVALTAQLQRSDHFSHFRSCWSYLRAAIPALLFAIFPKCPICWAAYASLLSYIGVYIPYYSWLIWIFAGFGALSLALSLRHALKGGEYRPLAMLLIAYSLLVLNRLYWDLTFIVFLAMALLVASTLFLKIQRKSFHLLKFKAYGS